MCLYVECAFVTNNTTNILFRVQLRLRDEYRPELALLGPHPGVHRGNAKQRTSEATPSAGQRNGQPGGSLGCSGGGGGGWR